MKNEMNDNFDVFDKYFMEFDIEDKMIQFKYNHSYRVLHQCDEISFVLNLDEDDNYIACLIGLLHDIGRFPQWTKNKSFNDELLDHAQLGVKILFDEGKIKDYDVSSDDYEIIKKAILNHNKFKIDEDLTVREKLHSKIIRDADKIDILYTYSENVLKLETDNSKIRDEIHDEFFKHNIIDIRKCNTINEKAVAFFASIYDLNYDYSKGYILDKNYITKIYDVLDNKEIIKPYYEEVIKYLEGSVKNDR